MTCCKQFTSSRIEPVESRWLVHVKIQLVFDDLTRQEIFYVVVYINMNMTSPILPATEKYNYIIGYIYDV